ncbi:enolase-phosphatase E1-like isoform X2 [Pieris brassicae]|nr:enolase-phosphatase E1-like isoform X2 [Pieris brassicae]
MHPDHDAKYFCPWCGKLFTMKHLYNKHIKTSHNGQTNCEVKDYHCDRCSVYFFVPSAMLHHNKFFHRQDIEMNTLGSSKKVKLFNQELVSILYCPFCGDEYNNKVNLDKHMEDDHADENQSPEDILRCPVCEAILYHLDAYELHLTFHSTEDVYSEPNEMVAEITEFSLEAVPPLKEKVEDVNDSVDNLLQMFMDESGEPKVKSKKHKKHKKSKKETITLDEFLNMNKDVFGDGLNVQGIEEVPTQMVLKRKYKTKNPAINVTNKVKKDLAKLKKHGIIIKSNSNNVVPNTSSAILNKTNTISANEKAQTSKDANEVISKLMGQGNSQIKIVKTSVNKQDSYQSSKIDSSSDYDNTIMTSADDYKEAVTNPETEDGKNSMVAYINKHLSPDDETKDEKEPEKIVEITEATSKTPNFQPMDEEYDSLPKTPEQNLPSKSFQNFGHEVTIKSSSQISFKNKNDCIDVKKEKPEDNEEETIEDNPEDDIDEEPIESDSSIKTNTLQSLNLNKGITIKPVLRNKILPPSTEFSDPENENPKDKTIIEKPIISLKGLSQQPTIKSFSSSSPSSNNHHMSDEEENKDDDTAEDDIQPNSDTQVLIKSEMPQKQESVIQSNADILKRLTNVTAKPVSSKTATNVPSRTDISKRPKNVIKRTMENDVEVLHIDDSDSDADIDHPTKWKQNVTNITNRLSNKPTVTKISPPAALRGLNKNVTIKSMSQQSTKCTEVLTKDGPKECKKMSVTRTFESKNTNITNNSNKLTEEQKNLQKAINNLKHVTIKPKNSFNANYKDEPSHDEDDEDHDYNSDQLEDKEYNSDTSTGKVQITEMNDAEASENEDPENGYESNVKVESPPQSPHSSVKNIDDNLDDFDIEDQIKANPIKKIIQPKESPQQQKPNNFPSLNKEITIKPARNMQDVEDEVHSQGVETIDSPKNVQTPKAKPVIQRQQVNRNSVQNQKTATSSNEVNTVKTVKTYQSQMVIEEVTTTVTKTIRTVNTQEVKNASQIVSRSIKPQTIHQPRNPNQATASRQASFVGAKVRNYGPQVRPVVANSSIALVPTRPRFAKPQMPSPSTIRKPAQIVQSRPRAITCNKPLRSASPATKRSSDEVGHFSCFKKAKESLFPVEGVTSTKDEDSVQYSSMKSKSTFSNVTQVQKGSQLRSETSTSSQQSISKLSGVSGLKIVKTSSKQATQIEEKCELPAPKNSTMAALEKLQKQGLLIKKPRLDMESETHSHSENEENDDGGEY